MAIEVSTTIEAAAADVWAILVDVERWPEWTPTMTTVKRLEETPFGPGSSARIKQPRLPVATWTVTSFEAEREFTWEAPAFGGRMTGSHLLTAEGTNTTTVTLTAGHRGRLIGLLSVAFERTARSYVAKEAAGLKARAESVVGSR